MHTIPNGNKREWKLVGAWDRASEGKRSEWEMEEMRANGEPANVMATVDKGGLIETKDRQW